jgi:hypothetical protein
MKFKGTLLLQLGNVGKKFYVDREESEDSLLLAASAAQQTSSVIERVDIFDRIENLIAFCDNKFTYSIYILSVT